MSQLDQAIQEQQNLINKGYSVEVIQTAALMVIASHLNTIIDQMSDVNADLRVVTEAFKPRITMQNNLPLDERDASS